MLIKFVSIEGKKNKILSSISKKETIMNFGNQVFIQARFVIMLDRNSNLDSDKVDNQIMFK